MLVQEFKLSFKIHINSPVVKKHTIMTLIISNLLCSSLRDVYFNFLNVFLLFISINISMNNVKLIIDITATGITTASTFKSDNQQLKFNLNLNKFHFLKVVNDDLTF